MRWVEFGGRKMSRMLCSLHCSSIVKLMGAQVAQNETFTSSFGMHPSRYFKNTFSSQVSHSLILNQPALLAVKTLPSGPPMAQVS